MEKESRLNFRGLLGILLIAIAFLYKSGGILPLGDAKLEKPEADIVALVDGISVSDDAGSSKLAGLFNALSEKLDKVTLNTNLQVQYLMDFIGKKTFGSELMDNGSPKYPKFSPSVAKAMTKVLGPQTDTDPITGDKKRRLARLFYGLSWKLYKSEQDKEYESYKAKALSAIKEYANVEPDPPDEDEDEDCPCEGLGYIIHGDGHRTPCPCIESGKKCTHNPKCGTEAPPVEVPKKKECVSCKKASPPKVSPPSSNRRYRRRGVFGGLFRR